MEISRKEYNTYKSIVKKWEKEFKEENKRNSRREDIKSAPSDVKAAYKIYWLVKTSLLEETIVDDDGIETDLASPLQESSTDNCVVDSTLSKSREKSYCVPAKSTEAADEFVNPDTVWGNHLKRSTIAANKTEKSTKPSSSLFTGKLFKGTKFMKRNPRTSMIFGQRSKSSDNVVSITNANNSQNSIDDVASCPTRLGSLSELQDDDLIGDSFDHTKIVRSKAVNSFQSVNILPVAENFADIRAKRVINKLDEGWLERCNEHCDLKDEPIVETTTKLNRDASSDEDYVYSSDDEAVPDQKTSPLNILPSLSDKITPNSENCIEANLSKTVTPKKSLSVETKSTAVIASNTEHLSFVSRTKRPLEGDNSRPAKKVKSLPAMNTNNERKLKILESKIASGKLNDNFVSIDLKRKRYVRGKSAVKFSTYKKQQWKKKKSYAAAGCYGSNEGAATGILKCFKCGDVGHFSKQCNKQNSLLPLDEYDDTEESPFPTLEEAAEMVKERQKRKTEVIEDENNFDVTNTAAQPSEQKIARVPPLYDDDGDNLVTPNEVFEALRDFGYTGFRPGQERVVMRILSGKSTLLISSTGSGKSLCYQLPAYLYAKRSNCISLVISPLVSLMEDQISNFPSFLNVACLHANQTAQQREKIIKKVINNEISVLLISPEAIVSGDRGILGRTLMQNFPPLAFVCIDEVHCVSQWSHNFRSSYLILCKILRERFNVKTFLGLTATATKSTIRCITEHLAIPHNDGDAIVSETIVPSNLILSASKDENKDAALLKLLTEAPFAEYDSLIVYCLRRNECERLASFLRTALQTLRKPLQEFSEKQSLSRDAEVYHAGLSAARRRKVQKYFMQGKLRIVVATVAFGMGINKANIRGIIHYNMPRSFEHYVQEVGRAGRDHLEARCHLFYDHQGNDLLELKRHIYGDSVDRRVIRHLLQRIFVKCWCAEQCEQHEVAFSIPETVRALDLPEESISTLLCYLELLPQKIVQVLPAAYTKCTIHVYSNALALRRAAKKCAPLAYAFAKHCEKNESSETVKKLDFSVIELANKIRWESGVVKNELKRIEWTEENGKYKKTGISVSFNELGFRVKAPGNLNETEQDNALDTLCQRVMSQENAALGQLDIIDNAFKKMAYLSVEEYLRASDAIKRSDNLKQKILEYFVDEEGTQNYKPTETKLKDKVEVMKNIHMLVSNHGDVRFNDRAIARIFHGIESPNFPAMVWAKTRFWRCGMKEDFVALLKFAREELLTLR